MQKISAVIITFNEEKNIARCISSLDFADEILIYDGNSTDRTREICSAAGCRIEMRGAWNGFGTAKREAVQLAANDWIFSIDADEEATPELVREIRSAVSASENSGEFAFRIRRKSFFLGEMIRHSGWQKDAPLRLFDRRKANFNSSRVHEKVEPDAGVRTLRGFMLHYTYADVQSYTYKMLQYAEAAALEKRARGKSASLPKAIAAALWKFLKMYFLKLGILDGRRGLILALNSAFGEYYRYLVI